MRAFSKCKARLSNTWPRQLYLGLPPMRGVPLLKMPSNKTKCLSSWRVCVFLKCAPLLQRQRGFLLIIWPPKYTKILHVTWGEGCSQNRCSGLGFSVKVPSKYIVLQLPMLYNCLNPVRNCVGYLEMILQSTI